MRLRPYLAEGVTGQLPPGRQGQGKRAGAFPRYSLVRILLDRETLL